jgi:hypothetical protein
MGKKIPERYQAGLRQERLMAAEAIAMPLIDFTPNFDTNHLYH